ncbi:MAG: DHH family phosphoesterase [Spirochaetota bacterium]
MASPAALQEAGSDAADFGRLLSLLDRGQPVAVQTHDYPDLDAVASAWGLARLLATKGFSARPCYRGTIRSRSLTKMVAELHIELGEDRLPCPSTQVIIVDGSPANGNVSPIEGRLLAVIDHHKREKDPSAPYIDIRPELASCSALIVGYWKAAGECLPRDLATAFLAGIQSDTDFLSRRVTPTDFMAYAELFELGDFDQASRIVRTALDLRELDLVIKALQKAETRNGVFFAWLPGSCGQEVLAVLAEFVLRTEELRLTIVAECGAEGEGPDGVHLSLRSKDPALSAFAVVKRALEGIGSGGGHAHSAGGFVPHASYPGHEVLKERFFASAIST